MNKARRQEVAELVDQLAKIADGLGVLWAEEQDYLDRVPDHFQNGRLYGKAVEAAEDMDSAIGLLDKAVEYLENVIYR